MVGQTFQMLSQICKNFKDFLFPGRGNDNLFLGAEPVGGLVSAYELISRLAREIEAHANKAPYPHVVQQLRRMATEKHDNARMLKSIIENLGERTRPVADQPPSGKNHWERLNFDLQDQIALDNFLLRLESQAGAVSGLAEILQEIKIVQKSHRRALSNLLAVADPQANQT